MTATPTTPTDPGSAGGGRATLAVIAATAGVSVATVSKVLNGRSDVAPATRSRVQAVLRQYDYVAPGMRRGDVPGRDTVEVQLDAPLNAYSTEIVQGVMDAGIGLGVGIVVGVRQRSEKPASWARSLVIAGRQALLAVTSELTDAHLAALSRTRVPLVAIDPLNQPRTKVTSVGSTSFAGGLAATRHLLALGHRRIAFVGGQPEAACHQARMQGYRAAMEAEGAPVLPGYVRTGRCVYEDGLAAASDQLELPEPPTAIFAGNDETAMGVYEAARTHGLRVPQDLSVVGFDDTQLATMAAPPLTTVRQPLREMGAVALRTALRLAAGETVDSHHVELATTLIERASTAPVRDGA